MRELISEGKYLSEVVHFSDEQIFSGATTYTCLMFLNKSKRKEFSFMKVNSLASWRVDGEAEEGKMPTANLTPNNWNFVVGRGAELFNRLYQMPVKLRDVTTNIFQGIVTSADPIYSLEILRETADGYRVHSKFLEKDIEIEQDFVKPFIKNYTIEPYVQPRYKHVLLFPYNYRGLVDWSEIEDRAPHTAAYLRRCKNFLAGREHGKMEHQQWYGYVYPKNLYLFRNPKLIVQVISSFSRFTIDESEVYFTGGGNGPYYGLLISASYDLKYALALLNLRLLEFLLRKISSPFRGGYWSYGKRFIEQLPIRTINFSDPDDVARHAQMVELVERMLSLHEKLAKARIETERTVIQNQIDGTDRQIDRLVYELYGLSDEEIAIVEEATVS